MYLSVSVENNDLYSNRTQNKSPEWDHIEQIEIS